MLHALHTCQVCVLTDACALCVAEGGGKSGTRVRQRLLALYSLRHLHTIMAIVHAASLRVRRHSVRGQQKNGLLSNESSESADDTRAAHCNVIASFSSWFV